MSSGSKRGGMNKGKDDNYNRQEQSFLNLAGTMVTIKADKWYNLATNRIVKKLKNRTFLVSPRVVGSCDQLRQFIIMNNLSLDSIVVSESSLDIIDDSIGHAASSTASSITSSQELVSANNIEIDMNELIDRYPQIESEERIISLFRNEVVIAGRKWHNLESSRSIGILKDKEFLISPRVAGSLELLIEFLLINQLEIDGVIIPNCRPDMRKSIEVAIDKRRPRIINTTDIDQIPSEEIDLLQPFNFNHITVKARLTRVIDGDTFDCVTVIDPHILALPTPIRVDNRTVIGQTVTICSDRSSSRAKRKENQKGPNMLIKLRIRLNGADAADCLTRSDKASNAERERMRLKKEAATDFVRRWAALSDNRVWLQLLGYDCRSRLLGQLYSRPLNDKDMNLSNSLTSELLRYRDPKCGKVALPYDGTTNRTEAWRTLLT